MKKKILKSVSIPEFKESIDEMPLEDKIFVDKAMAISYYILKRLKLKGLKQKDLANLMGKSEAELSKLLSGTHNYTLRTLSKMEAFLETDIINIPFLQNNYMNYANSPKIELVKNSEVNDLPHCKIEYTKVIQLYKTNENFSSQAI
jgi:transcriptional regulator with XRE-family HTH domain